MPEMKLKVMQGVKLTQDQAKEVAESIMTEPDMGWGWDMSQGVNGAPTPNVYEEELQGEHGTYSYRVNLSWDMITLKSVK